jgi:ribosomal protein L11 methyltransferase
MKARQLWKVEISCSAEAEEAVSALLGEVCGRAVSSFTNVETGRTTVTVFFEGKPVGFEALRAWLVAGLKWLPSLVSVRRHGSGGGRWPISLTKVRREDWSESWKKHFQPLEVGARLLVRPSWSRRKAKPGQAVVVLDPGLSFGTGQHPTTGFCLKQLVARRRPGQAQSLLDVGTGSGILAIAAAKLGYRQVEALEVDPEAVRIARANARSNGVLGRVRIRRQDFRLRPTSAVARSYGGRAGAAARNSRIRFSVVCANLVSNLLIEERERLVSRVERGGLLVLAGILATEFAGVQKTYENAGFKLVASRQEKEWRSGAFVGG